MNGWWKNNDCCTCVCTCTWSCVIALGWKLEALRSLILITIRWKDVSAGHTLYDVAQVDTIWIHFCRNYEPLYGAFQKMVTYVHKWPWVDGVLRTCAWSLMFMGWSIVHCSEFSLELLLILHLYIFGINFSKQLR